MYAVIEAGGKQHRVVEGEVIKVEKIEAETGSTIDFDRVLMVGEGESIKVGAPVVDGAKVSAEVIQHGRGDKVTIVKFKRRKHHMKRQGHRQWFTEIKITAINSYGRRRRWLTKKRAVVLGTAAIRKVSALE